MISRGLSTMDHRAGGIGKSAVNLIVDDEAPKFTNKIDEACEDSDETKTRARKYSSKLYGSDVSINTSYVSLKTLPYYVVCRRRALKKTRLIARQLNREIMHIAMMQSYALAGVKIDRIFSIGFPPEATHVPDFATIKERRRINQLIYER